MNTGTAIRPHSIEDWFAQQDWEPFAFQREVWGAYDRDKDVLVHASTGSGKTLAAWGGAINEYFAETSRDTHDRPSPLRVLWITPMRALAHDTVKSLRRPIQDMALPWTIDLRTGDTSSSRRAAQRKCLPTALVTTPESLALLLTYKDTLRQFRSLRCVVVDEWHELLSTKRGVQTELCLARLRRSNAQLRTIGLSATIGNLRDAMAALQGVTASRGKIVRGQQLKQIEVETLMPLSVERFPWSGHIGLNMLPQVIDELEKPGSALLFTNTRSQAEIWFQALTKARPDWLGEVAIHHGSLDRSLRVNIESMLREGLLRCVVCTSSLDLGVDFSPVDRVLQVGSPKGIARLMQRAGRSGHQPGAVSRALGVPTNALEIIEFSAAREKINHALTASDPEGSPVEHRQPIECPLDVLAQHVVTLGMADQTKPDDILREVRSTRAYRDLTDQQWQWTLDFVTHGGETLRAYPQYARLREENGCVRVDSPQIARRHRMTMGTITGDSSMQVKFVRGKTLGSIEESFISRLHPGDRFSFAGRTLELVRVRNMTAYVRTAKQVRGLVPRWVGGRSPLSTELASAVRMRLEQAGRGEFADREMRMVKPLLQLQQHWSTLPARNELLIERTRCRRVWNCFVFSFGGRLVHEGLSVLVAHRVTRERTSTIRVTANDYGFHLASQDELDFDETGWRRLLSPDSLVEDLLTCLNESQLTRRRFRSIAQIAGLVFPGFPGQSQPTRHLQASSDLFFDVFGDFDPGNLLLDQARREVLSSELEITRLSRLLKALRKQTIVLNATERISPLAFPLWADDIRAQQLTSESWQDRVQRMAAELEQAAGTM